MTRMYWIIGGAVAALGISIGLALWHGPRGWTQRAADSVDYTALTGLRVSSVPAAPSAALLRQTEAVPSETAETGRWIVREARLQIEVDSVARAAMEIREWVAQESGYVAFSQTVATDGGRHRGDLTLRIPVNRLDQAVLRVRQSASRVVHESGSSQDHHDQAIDLQARLRNLEAAEQEMRAIMTEVRRATHDLDKLLRVHQETTRLREEIERHRGQLEALEGRVAMATLHVELLPVGDVSGPVVAGWSLSAQWQSGVRVLVWVSQRLATVLIYAVTVGSPLMAVLGLPAWLVWKLTRRRLQPVAAT